MPPKPKDLRDSITKELGDFVKSKSSTFACGGSIPISTEDVGSDAAPFSLRWDSAGAKNGAAKLTFPVDKENEEHKGRLAKLVDDCQPASFGYKGEKVLDESYRKATKMDRSTFSVDFCPYELGIFDTIAQVLLPNAGGDVGTKGVKAELYKLNIYAAPSGFFKAHVDTPRSDTQFGSLVVSLPCHHEGGQLVVRHAGQEVTFDWSAPGASDTSIQWAAFYNDCEHEVKEVSEGHRVTLTYNLYYAPGVGDLAGNSPVMDIFSLPLHQKIQGALAESKFMEDGGNLGVFCQHAYAHSTPEGAEALPGVLKGSDMAVYSIFLALGLDVFVRPVPELHGNWYFGGSYDEEDEDGNRHEGEDYIGKKMKEIVLTEYGGDEDTSSNEVLQSYGGEWLKVNWLTAPTSKNVGFVHLTYGNEPGLNHVYTHAALIISIPPASKRGALTPKPVAKPVATATKGGATASKRGASSSKRGATTSTRTLRSGSAKS